MGYSHSEGATPAFMTMDEVLGYLRVTSRTIYRLIKAGDLPAVRVGRQWRFRQSDLDAWLNRQRINVN
jgi:excisionase family DNA binding protein